MSDARVWRVWLVEAAWRISDFCEVRTPHPWRVWAPHLATVIDVRLAYDNLPPHQQLDASNDLAYSRSQLPTLAHAAALAFHQVIRWRTLWRCMRYLIQTCTLLALLWHYGSAAVTVSHLSPVQATRYGSQNLSTSATNCTTPPYLVGPPSPYKLWLAQAASDHAHVWLVQDVPPPFLDWIRAIDGNQILLEPHYAGTRSRACAAELWRATKDLMDRYFDSLFLVDKVCHQSYVHRDEPWWLRFATNTRATRLAAIRRIKTSISWVNDMELLLNFAKQADATAAALTVLYESIRDAVGEADRLSSLQIDPFGRPCVHVELCEREWQTMRNYLRSHQDWADFTDLNTYVIRHRISALLFFKRLQLDASDMTPFSDTLLQSSGPGQAAFATLNRICSDLISKDRLYSVSHRAGAYAGMQWAYRRNNTFNAHWSSCASSAGNFTSAWWQPRAEAKSEFPATIVPVPSRLSRLRHWVSYLKSENDILKATRDKTYRDLERPHLRHSFKSLDSPSSVLHQSCISAYDYFQSSASTNPDLDSADAAMLELEETWFRYDEELSRTSTPTRSENRTARAMILDRARHILRKGVWCLPREEEDEEYALQQDEKVFMDEDEYILERVLGVRLESDRVAEEKHRDAWE